MGSVVQLVSAASKLSRGGNTQAVLYSSTCQQNAAPILMTWWIHTHAEHLMVLVSGFENMIQPNKHVVVVS